MKDEIQRAARRTQAFAAEMKHEGWWRKTAWKEGETCANLHGLARTCANLRGIRGLSSSLP